MPQMQKPVDPRLKATLISMLSLLRHKAEDKGLDPVISVTKIIDMLKITGLSLTYQQLVDLTKDPTIAKSIKSINKNQVVLNLSSDEPAMDMNPDPVPDMGGEEFNPDEFGGPEGEEEFNPDDFAAPEGDESEEPSMQEPEEDANMRQQKSTVSSMAARALKRPD